MDTPKLCYIGGLNRNAVAFVYWPVSSIQGEVINIAAQESEAAAVCGVPAIEPFPPGERIVGGIEAKPNSWPWMCLMEMLDDVLGWKSWCGCSVLNNVTLLTAAHCLYDSIRRLGNTGHDFRVRCGIHYSGGNNSHEQMVSVSNYTYHELFNFDTIDYDLGILKLSTPQTFNDFVSPVCLPQKDAEPGTKAIATGWGFSLEEIHIGALRQVTLPIISRNQCIEDYATINLTITDRMLCAGYQEGGQGTCYGDSGGPLVVKRGGIWETQGITSFGNSCAQKGYPGAFTRVTQLMTWIKQRL